MHSNTRQFLQRVCRAANEPVEVVSTADNCRFDERLSTARWTRFEAEAQRTTAGVLAVWADWMEMEQRYRQAEVEVTRLSVPATFLAGNESAWLLNPAEQQTVVRLESVEWPLRLNRCTSNQLQQWLAQRRQTGDAGDTARAALTSFLKVWNDQRDHRPMFGTFLDAVQDAADDADWPHRLRDALGLGHYGGEAGQDPVVVMQMRYSLSEAIAAASRRGWAATLALPTPLDGCMHEYFFPAPAGHPYGATLHLEEGCADQPTPEILHACFDYRLEHIHAIGVIERSHGMHGPTLANARDQHLDALRALSERPNFGEPLSGRVLA